MSTNANICQRLRTLSESLGADAEICDYAAARIEELEADLDYHKKLCIPKTLDELEAVNLRSIILDQDADIKKLAAQLADAKADGERLDWLAFEGAITLAVNDGWQIEWQFSPDGCNNKTATGKTLRAAIDAAMKL